MFINPEIVPYLFLLLAFIVIGYVSIPYFKQDVYDQRLKNVTNEREEMREARLSDLKLSRRSKGIKIQRKNILARTVDVLKLEEIFKTEQMRDKLSMAGMRSKKHLTTYLFLQLTLPFVLGALAFLYANIKNVTFFQLILFSTGGVVAGFYAPSIYVNNLIKKRQEKLGEVFAEMLDFLLICVQSGMSVEASFLKVGEEIATRNIAMAEEIQLLNAELSYLPERRQAFENISKRVGIEAMRNVMTGLIQADKYGTPVTQTLRVMAQDYRDSVMAKAEKKASSLPPLLTVPMILFFLPVIFVIILSPAVLRMMGD